MLNRNLLRRIPSHTKRGWGVGGILLSGLLLGCGDSSSSTSDAQQSLDSGVLSDPLSMPQDIDSISIDIELESD